MKCPVCGRDSGLNPFSICQFCGNALQQPEEDGDGAEKGLPEERLPVSNRNRAVQFPLLPYTLEQTNRQNIFRHMPPIREHPDNSAFILSH